MHQSLRYILTILILAFIIWRLRSESYTLQQLAHDWGQLSISQVMLAVGLLPLNLGLESWKWLLAIRRLYPNMGLHESGLAILRGSALALVTPNRLGEYAGRVFSLPPGYRLEAAVATLVCRLSQLGATLIFGLLSLTYLAWQKIGPELIILGLLPPLTLLVSSLGIFALQPTFSRRFGRLILRQLLVYRWGMGVRTLQALLQVPRRLVWQILGLALLRWLVFALQYFLLLNAFGVESSAPVLLALIAVVYLIKSFIPSIALAELGIREHIAMGVFKWVLIPGAVAFHATLLLYLLNIILPGVIGALLLYRLQLPGLAPAQ